MKNDYSELISALTKLNGQPTSEPNVELIQSLGDLEKEYKTNVKNIVFSKLDFGKWLPSLGRSVRGIVPGELVTILADTGVGKTAILQNIALQAAPLKTLLFEIELPGTLTFERFLTLQQKKPGYQIERSYMTGEEVDWKTRKDLDHIFVCSSSKLTIETMEGLINAAEKKMGERPALVLVDYIGLISSKGNSRYERMSYVAEQLKVIAKATNTIMVCASQIHRKGDDAASEVYLHDAKDSGSIENSSGLVLGAWREGEDGRSMKVKVLKNTKGRAGFTVNCDFNGETLTITEIQKPDNTPAWAAKHII